MAVIAFDTLQCARRLIGAGFPQPQADELAEIMSEAFVYNVDQLVTKDYLEAKLDASIRGLELRLEQRFTQIDVKFTEIDGKFRLIFWMLGIIILSTTVPQLVSLFGN